MKKVLCIAVVGLLPLFAVMVSEVLAQGDVNAGASVYAKKKCANCHGDNSQGDGRMAQKMKLKIADWTSKDSMSKLTDQYLTDMITKGGKAMGKSKIMAAYGKKLTDSQIQDLLAFIRSLGR